jgi:hypothetical protein
MPLPTFYDTGTISVTQGQVAFTGQGTLWGNGNILAGDEVWLPSQPEIPPQQIDADPANGAGSFTVPWPGATEAEVPYQIRYKSITERSTAQTRRYLEQLGQLAALGIQPDAFGLFADRDAFDDAAKDFIFLSLNGDAGVTTTAWTLYIKLSATVGDWSTGQTIEGAPGPQGQNVVWLAAAGAPGAGTGANGDMYLDTATGDIYGPKAAGAWGAPVANITGPLGDPGADGTDPGILYNWSEATADEDPGAGNIAANHANLALATMLFVSKTNRAGDDMGSRLLSFAASTSPTKGQVTLTRSGGNAQADADVTGVTDAVGYVKVAISGPGGASGFLTGNAISLQFSRTGDKGADGTGAVDSVNGQTGAVVLDAGDIGFTPAGGIAAENVQGALEELDSEKASAAGLFAHVADTGNPHSVTKAQVGLGNVTNDAQLKIASNLSDITSRRAAALNLATGYVLAQSAVALSHTGDTNETVLATIAIPANVIGANGRVVIETSWSFTSSANSKTLRVRFGASGGGVGGTALLALGFTTTAMYHDYRAIANRNATNSQIAMLNTGVGGGWGGANNTPIATAVDTTAATEVVLSAQLANAGETITLESYQVLVYPKD